jgi:hypothetical protein
MKYKYFNDAARKCAYFEKSKYNVWVAKSIITEMIIHQYNVSVI